MPAGRPRKPSKLKSRETDHRAKREINDREPVLPEGVGDPPEYLGVAARAEWRRVVGILGPAGVLTQGDFGIMCLYCQAWGRWLDAEGKIAKTGLVIKDAKGIVKRNPYLAVSTQASDQCARFASALGLDPSSRSKIISSRPRVQQVATRPKNLDPPAPKKR